MAPAGFPDRGILYVTIRCACWLYCVFNSYLPIAPCKMKKIITLLLLIIVIQTAAHAQTNNTTALSAAFELGIPTTSIYSIGTGASLKFEFPVVNPVSISLTGGITSMFYKSNLFGNGKTPGAAGYIPLKAGVKYYFARGVYAGGEAGTAIETNYDKKNLFAFSIGPGFVAPINGKSGVDFSFRYEAWESRVHLTVIRVAYRFGW